MNARASRRITIALAALLCACSTETTAPGDGGPGGDGAGDQAAADQMQRDTGQQAPAPDLAADLLPPDRGPDLAPPGSKQMGEHCQESVECADGVCAAGEYTSAHCTPLCTDDTPCIDEEQNVAGVCTPVGGFEGNICIFFCGFLANGAECPGDLVCQGGAACR